jgi:hypothetical protein
MAKSWSYRVWLWETDRSVPKVFEIEDVSPFKINGGQFLNTKMSEDMKGIANPMMMGQFIASIGDANTLSFKKTKDTISTDLEKAKNNKTLLEAAIIEITPSSSIDSKLKGKAREQAITDKSMAAIELEPVTVTQALVGKQPGYDYFTFECSNVGQRFKGRDY